VLADVLLLIPATAFYAVVLFQPIPVNVVVITIDIDL
jgi:hypothetical protein